MIDIENEVFTAVATELRKQFKGILVYGDEGQRVMASFPVVTIMESDNVPFRRSMTSDKRENHITVRYRVNAYSNKTSGKKAECKAIMSAVDSVLVDQLGFVRASMNQVKNLEDATIYRMVAEYTAVVSKNKIIYRS